MNNSRPCWIERTFQKRECICFIAASTQNDSACSCGLLAQEHETCENESPPDLEKSDQPTSPSSQEVDHHWCPLRHSVASPTDAFGTIEFQKASHSFKAKYVRVSFDTQPEILLQLMTREWTLDLPKVVISVHGGKANFQLQPKLKKGFQEGLVRAAKTTGAWIITAGTNTGVTSHVGEAMMNDRSPCVLGKRVVTIGIAPWGVVKNRKTLIGTHTAVPYYSISSPKSKFRDLNSNHSYFILADNGTVGRYGAEIVLRKKLERFISKQQICSHGDNRCSLPVVCVLVEGGVNSIRTVLEYVTDNPPVPVVICDGSGRSADLIAFAHKYIGQDESTPLEIRNRLLEKIEETFQLGQDQSEKLYRELLQCIRRADMITVFRMGEEPYQDLDQAILKTLLRQPHLKKLDQLNLTLTWNRIDVARSEVFFYGVEWPPGSLEQALMDALALDRVDFVRAILENGVSMQRFLTVAKLEELYNTWCGPVNILQHLIKDVKKHVPRGYMYRLYDIGLVVEKLMGGAYRSQYCKGVFRNLYIYLSKRGTKKRPSPDFDMPFLHPFNDLLIWSVLTMRPKMALFVWQQGRGSLVRALVASKLYKSMSKEASDNDFEEELHFDMLKSAKEFDTFSLELLDFFYRQDVDLTLQILTHELTNWSKQTCLGLAVGGRHHAFLAHSAAQVLVADLWMGGLRIRKATNLKVILGLILPVTIPKLPFKTREELQRMPQTETEHQLELEDVVEQPDSQSTEVSEEPETGESKFSNFRRSMILLPQTPVSHSLSVGKKFYEFYAAPITKFWSHCIAYIVFLFIFTFVVLVKTIKTVHWTEYYIIVYQFSILLEKIREIVSTEPEKLRAKLMVWSDKLWNPCDVCVILFFFVGVSLRWDIHTIPVARLFYCLTIMYWYLRILDMFSVNKNLGPYVTMMQKMTLNMVYVVVLLMVVLMSYGVARQGIMSPNEEANWGLVREIFFKPYWMVYGELFVESIDPTCGNGVDSPACPLGQWINPAIMTIYLLLANLLLVNLLIAVFNNIYNEVSAVSQQLWKSQRYWVVLEYEQKPLLPPPFIIISHLIFLLRVCLQKWRRKPVIFDHGLKLFCDEITIEKIHTFEEQCIDGYLSEVEGKESCSTEEQIKFLSLRADLLSEISQEIYGEAVNTGQRMFTLQRQFEQMKDKIIRISNLQSELLRMISLQPELLIGDQISMELDIDSFNLYEEEREPMTEQKSSSTENDQTKLLENKVMPNLEVPLSIPTFKIPQANNGSEISSTRPKSRHRSMTQPVIVKKNLPERSNSTRTRKLSITTVPTPSVPVGVVCPYPRRRKPNYLNYRSITEDIEDTAMIFSREPLARRISHEREEVLNIETAILRDAEAEDYNIMENLIQKRMIRDSEDLDQSLDHLCDMENLGEREVDQVEDNTIIVISDVTANEDESEVASTSRLPT